MSDPNFTRPDNVVSDATTELQTNANEVSEALKALASDERFQLTDVLEIQKNYLAEKERILAKYPEIREELERSFKTPQVGEHHTEGETMEAHLALLVRELNRLKEGQVNPAIKDEEIRKMLIWAAQNHFDDLKDYPFLHDIKKPDCLVAILEEGAQRVEMTWDQWQAVEAKGKPYQVELPEERTPVTKLAYFRGTENKKRIEAPNLEFDIATDQHARTEDGVVLNPESKGKGIVVSWEEWQAIKAKGQPYTYVKESRAVPIKTLGYFQKSRVTGADKREGNHGYEGARLLREKLGVDKLPGELTLKAIEMHETAFQEFDKGNMSAAAFEENYGQFSDEELATMLTASYIDFAGSLKADGKPEFGCLSNVIQARSNYHLIKRYLDSGAVFQKNKLDGLRAANRAITAEELEAIREKGEVYDAEAVRQALGPIAIAPDIKEKIVSLLATGQPVNANKVLGAELGKALKGDLMTVKNAVAGIGKDSFVLQPEKSAWGFIQ